jgi:hypothetical protein
LHIEESKSVFHAAAEDHPGGDLGPGKNRKLESVKDCIQGLWIGSKLSLMEQLSIKSYLAQGHSYHLYVYGKIHNVPDGVALKDGNEILSEDTIFSYRTGPGKGSYAAYSNLFRYKLLREKGGIWSDMDVVCLKPFAFESECVFMMQNTLENKTEICNAIMKVPPGNRCIEACYNQALAIDPDRMEWGESGPALLTANVSRFGLTSCALPPRTFAPIDYWEFRRLTDSHFHFEITEDIYAIHLWNEMWRRNIKRKSRLKRLLKKQRFDKNALYGPDTLYGRLQRMYL